MSRAVRRLTLDYQPLWIALGMLATVLLGVMDWGWLFSVRNTQMIQWFVPLMGSFLGAQFMPKMPAWQALPVPASDRRRALWWIWIGLPLIRIVLSMLAAWVGLGFWKAVHATPLQIMGMLGGQLVMTVIVGTIFSGTFVLRRRYGVSGGIAVIIPLFLMAALASLFRFDTPAEIAGVWIGALALTLATWAAADRAGAIAARLSDRSEAAAKAPSETGGGVRGWAAILPPLLGVMVAAVAVTVLINYSLLRAISPDIHEGVRRNLPGQFILTGIVLSAIGGQVAPYALRALRVLPIGPTTLTAVLQGFMLALLLIPVAAMWAVMRAMGMDTALVPAYLYAMVPIVALRLPVNLRTGIQIGAFISILPIFPLAFLRFAPWAQSPGFAALMLGLAIVLWVWSWWELAYARAAYRVQPIGLSRWRGGIN